MTPRLSRCRTALSLLVLLPWTSCAAVKQGGAHPANVLSDDNLTLLGARLGDATLQSVKERLGDAPVAQVGHGGDWREETCYLFGDAPERSAVVIFRSSSMASRPHGLTSFAVGRLSRLKDHGQCLGIPGVKGQVATGGGITLGMTVGEVEARVGAGVMDGSRMVVIRTSKLSTRSPPAPGQDWDLTTTFVGMFEAGRLVEFEISRIVSY